MNQPDTDLDPLDVLDADHRVIERVLSALEIADAGAVDKAFFEDVVAFVEKFADGSHHQREEEHLFPALERAGIQRTMGPIGVMLEEHEAARRHVQTLRHLLASGTVDQLCVAGRAYAELMRGHIMKEDGVLFPMARSVLSPSAQRALHEGFASLEDADDKRRPFAQMADRLWRRASGS